MTSFDAYTDLVRQISALRQADHHRHTDTQERAAALQANLDRLTARHTAQATHLVELARTLKLPAPTLQAPQPSGVADPRDALHHATQALDAADTDARHAEDAANRPALLPDLSPTARNTFVYIGCAAAGWLLQCGLFVAISETSFGVLAWSLCGLPALAFFAGYLTVATLGQPRLSTGPAPSRNVGLGGVICFVGMPLAWLLLIALFTVLRT